LFLRRHHLANISGAALALLLGSVSGSAASNPQVIATGNHWSALAAANYLDSREAWWLKWPVSQRDHGTACISCHTALPYALSRRTLRPGLSESVPSPIESAMLANVIKRVRLWSEVEPFYNDAQAGPNKSVESRNTEAVLNALVLANYDRESGTLTRTTRSAFEQMWALQKKTGPEAGAWTWLNFHNAPWEGNESQYMGAVYAAIAVGIAPGNLASQSDTAPNVGLLEGYLQRDFGAQALFNRLLVLWASGRLPGLLTAEQKAGLKDDLLSHQRPDGGWSLAAFGPWQRRDGTPVETRSDGYATGLAVFALEQAGLSQTDPCLENGLAWLRRNQSAQGGYWASYSVNKNRDPETDIGKFMTDAATSFAVLALTNSW
jgi:squalene-hopene/tetraprenyl-beta-curcumene cyclase